MKKILRFMSVSVLSSVLILSSVQGLHAEGTRDGFTSLGSKFVTGVTSGTDSSLVEKVYDDNDLVDIIVELNDKPLVDYVDDGEVLEFTLSAKGRSIESSLETQQAKVLQDVEKIADSSLEVQYSYTRVLNGFAVETEYKNLEEINALPNVKRAYPAQIYDRVEPMMKYSNGTVGAYTVWDKLAYKGENTVVGILDTGLDLNHPAFKQDLTDVKVTKDDIKQIVSDNTLKAEELSTAANADSLYSSSKVPFQFDYADKDTSVSPESDATAAEVDHGTHVAGTVGGYDEDAKFSGVAPNAQLMIFKVFSDHEVGAKSTTIAAALEDAVLLDIDVINMSLGSSAGFSTGKDEILDEIYDRVGSTGIVLDISAGNATDAAANNNWSGYTPTSTPDHGIVGSPSTFNSALSVASMDNTFMVNPALKVGDDKFAFTDTAISVLTLKGRNLDYVMVPGTGTLDDYAGLDVEGKIAVISRGAIDFTSKVANAASKGAVAAFIYNNTSGALLNMASTGNTIPAIFISDVDGQILANRAEKRFTVEVESVISENTETANLPSDFSSTGTTNLLEIKPEIAAPGGYIYSSVPSGTGYTYASMSGTSMASPHVAGISALTKQYVNTFANGLSDVDKVELINKLLMSTATPAVDADGVVYPVRKQGAGMINVYDALKTPAYLSATEANSDGTFRPKLELGDDVAKTGVYNLKFDVTNISTVAQTYAVDVTTTTPYFLNYDGVNKVMANENYEFETIVSGDTTVTVAPGDTEIVNLTVTLDDPDSVAALNEVFNNGFYVEGYATLKSTANTPDDVDLSIPFLGFYGDWEQAPIFEQGTWINEEISNNFDTRAIDGSQYLGKNYFNGPEFDINPDMLTLSPNGDEMFDELIVQEGLIRNAEKVTHSITSKDSGTEVFGYTVDKAFKTYYNSSAGMQAPYNMYLDLPTFVGLGKDGKAVADGKYTYTITADLGYREGIDDTYSFDFIVDTKEPVILNPEEPFIVVDGRTYLNFTIVDENFMIQSNVFTGTVEGNTIVDRTYLDEQYTPNSGQSTHEYSVDVTGLFGQIVYVQAVDSGMNFDVYSIEVPTPEVNENEIILTVDETFKVKLDDTVDPETVVWSSKDEAIARVDETGLVTAVAKGVTEVDATVEGTVLRTVQVTVLTNVDVLQNALDSAHRVENLGYTQNSWNAFQSAILDAQGVLDDPNSTQQDYLDAIKALADAKEGLVGEVKNLPTKVETTVGSVFELDPQPAGGTWTFDSSKLELVGAQASGARLRAQSTTTSFKVLASGTTTLTYNAPNGATVSIEIVSKDKDTPVKPNPDEPGTDDPTNPVDPGTDQPTTPTDGGAGNGTGTLPGTGQSAQSYTPAYGLVALGGALVIVTRLRKKKTEEI